MSCISVQGWKVVAVTVCLVALLPGCHVPPLPSGVGPQTLPDADKEDGWLFKKLTGKPAADSPAGANAGGGLAGGTNAGGTNAGGTNAGGTNAGSVRQVSSIEPMPGADGSANRGTVLPPAGVADPKPKPSDDDGGFDWSALYPTTIYKNMQAAVGLGPDEKIARAAYQEGEALYRQKKFAEAASHFKTAADRWPDSPLEEDALFLLAECQFFTDQYSKALDTYGTLLKKHENSRYLDRAVAREFAIGRYWEQMDAYEPHWPVTPNFTDKSRPLFDTWGNAVKAYENARLGDPTGPMADHSLMAAANANFVRGRYEDAAYNYDLLRKEYPKSDHIVQASVLGMKSKLEMYHGPMYDGKPLVEANKIAEQALNQFPERLGPEKDRIVQAKNQMVEGIAERDWAMGQYYDKRGYYGAARYYYEAVVKSHPQTHVAQMARSRLAEIQDKPARPPNYFKWIDDVLPSKYNRAISQSPQ